MDSSPARNVEAARAREGERSVFPKKEIEGVLLEDSVLLLAVTMVVFLHWEWEWGNYNYVLVP